MPSRSTVTVMVAPGEVPRKAVDSWLAVAIEESPTMVMMSPALMPTSAAGVPLCTVVTVTPNGVSATLTPMKPIGEASTFLPAFRSSSSGLMVATEMAKPTFCASGIPAELMPIRSPLMLTSAPPELPWLMAASV